MNELSHGQLMSIIKSTATGIRQCRNNNEAITEGNFFKPMSRHKDPIYVPHEPSGISNEFMGKGINSNVKNTVVRQVASK
jgi:hypothetical protein